MDNLGVAINDTTLKAYAASKGMKKSAIDNLTTQQKVGLALELFMSKSEYAMGNYAKENDTLAGSMTTLKAAWNNFLSGAGGENAPEILGRSIDRTADIVVKNIGEIVPRLSKGLSKVLSTVGTKMPQLMETLMPGIETGAGALIDMLGDALPYLLQTAVNLVPSVVSGLGKVFTKVAQKAPEMLKSLWSGLKNAGKQIGGMIFGMDGDNVKWPTWEDVKGYAAAAWDGIKNGVKNIGSWAGKLIFGEDENGEVKWPEWGDVKDAAKAAWAKIKDAALHLGTEFGKLVFGTDENGDVQWPTPDQITQSVTTWWNNTAKPAIDSVTKWGLQLFDIGEGDDAYTSGAKVAEKVKGWWDSVKSQAEEALQWAIGVFGIGDADGSLTVANLSDWWKTKVSPRLKGVLDFGLGAFGLDSLDEFAEKAKAGAEEIKTYIIDPIVNFYENTIKPLLKDIEDLLGIKPAERSEQAVTGEKLVQEIDAMLQSDSPQRFRQLPQEIQQAYADLKANESAGMMDAAAYEQAYEKLGKLYEEAISKLDDSMKKTQESSASAQQEVQQLETELNNIAGEYTATVNIEVNGELPDTSPFTRGGGRKKHVTGTASADSMDGSNAKGLSYVPKNGYRAILHRGEMVLNRSRADAYRNGQAGFDVSAFMNQMFSVVKGAMEAANISMNMDGQKVAQNTSERQSADEMAWRFAIG